jgi:hypothetical protein
VDDTQTSRDSELTFTAPADGAYQIRVTDLHRRGDWRFVYRLTIARPQPDFKASITADALTLTPGTPMEIPITIERAAGFAEEIEFTAAELPPGVTAMPVKSLAHGETSKAVKLILHSAAGPASGTLTITGRSTGDLKLSRPAQAPLVGTARTSRLWLTVTAPAPK